MKIPGIIPAAILIAAVAIVAYYFPGQPWTYIEINPGLFFPEENNTKKNATIRAV